MNKNKIHEHVRKSGAIMLRKSYKTNAESGFNQSTVRQCGNEDNRKSRFFSVRMINQEKPLQDTTDQDAVYKHKVRKKISVRKTNANECGPVISRIICPVQIIANLQRKHHSSSKPTLLPICVLL